MKARLRHPLRANPACCWVPIFVLACLVQPALAQETRTPSPTTNTCYVLSYDHGGLVLWGYDHFLEQFRATLGWLDRHPKLKMGLDHEAWMYDWLADHQPAVLQEIRQALQTHAGRLGIGSCTYGQPLAAWLLGESNIRQIALGTDTVYERLGYEVQVYSFSEHAAFSQLPQILDGLGFRGALMRTHYLMYGFCPGYDAPIVSWQGPDGTRLPCVPTYVHQERQIPGHQAQPPGPFGLTTEDTWMLTRYPSPESPAPLDVFRARFAHIQPLLATRIDDSGLKREALVEELDARDDYQWVTLEDVFDRFPDPNRTVTPMPEDFGTRMPWGYRGNELFDMARRAEISVLTAERLLARVAAPNHGIGPSPRGRPFSLEDEARCEQELRQAWKDLLVGQHHDVQIVARTAAFGREHLLASLHTSRQVIRTLLSREADTSEPAEPTEFIAFNPLPWRRAEASAELPDGTVLRVAAEIPALGFGGFDVSSRAPKTSTNLTFTAGPFQVTFHPQGGIASLNTLSGQPLLKTGIRSGRLAGVIDGTPAEGEGSVQVHRSGAGAEVQEQGRIGPLPYTIHWFFPDRGRRVECRIRVRFDGERIGAPTDRKNDSRSCFTHEQKLRLRLFPAVAPDRALGLYDVPFGMSTTHRPYVEGNYWTALADEQGGLAIANRGTMGSVREEDGAFSVPLAFSTAYVWGSEMLGGEREWQLALLPWTGDWRNANIHRRALEYAFPLVALPGRNRGSAADFLRLEDPTSYLTAFYVAQGHGYVRIFNGCEQPQTLHWQPPTSATIIPVNLRHRETPGIPDPLRLRPWQIQTLRLW